MLLRVLALVALAGAVDEAIPEVEQSVLQNWHSSIRDEAGRQFDFVSELAAEQQGAHKQPRQPGAPRVQFISIERDKDSADGEHVARIVLQSGADGVLPTEDDLLETLAAAIGLEKAQQILAAAGMAMRAAPQLPALEAGVSLAAVLELIGESLPKPPASQRPQQPAPASSEGGPVAHPSGTDEMMRFAAPADGEPAARAASASAGSGNAEPKQPPSQRALASGRADSARAPAQVDAAPKLPGRREPAAAAAQPGAASGAPAGFAHSLQGLGAEGLRALETELRAQQVVLTAKLDAIAARRAALAAARRVGSGGDDDDEMYALMRQLFGTSAKQTGTERAEREAAGDAPQRAAARQHAERVLPNADNLFAELAATLAADMLRRQPAVKRAAGHQRQAATPPAEASDEEEEEEDDGEY